MRHGRGAARIVYPGLLEGATRGSPEREASHGFCFYKFRQLDAQAKARRAAHVNYTGQAVPGYAVVASLRARVA